jgi:hypothetical protein
MEPIWPTITLYERGDGFKVTRKPPRDSREENNHRSIEFFHPKIGTDCMYIEISSTCKICLKERVPTIYVCCTYNSQHHICIDCVQMLLKPIPNEKEIIQQAQREHLQKQLIELEEKKQKQKEQCKKERKEIKAKLAAIPKAEKSTTDTTTATAAAANTTTSS